MKKKNNTLISYHLIFSKSLKLGEQVNMLWSTLSFTFE